MRTFTTLIILLFFVQSSYGQTQKIDSLKKVLAKLPPEGNSYTGDTMRVRVLLGVGELTENLSEVGSIFEKAITIAEKSKNDYLIANTYNQYGQKILSSRNLYKIGEILFKALTYAEKAGDKLLIGNIHINIGKNYLDLFKNTVAREHFIKAKTIFESLGNQVGIIKSLNHIGISYARDSRNKEAISFYREALSLSTTHKISLYIPNFYNNIAIAFEQEKQIDSAIIYEKRALEEIRVNQPQNIKTKVASLIETAFLFYKKEDYKASINYANEALLVNNGKDLYYESDAYGVLFKSYKGLGVYKNSLQSLEKNISLRDSLESYQKEQQINALNADYNFEISKNKVKELDNDLSKQKIQRIIFSVLSILLTIIVFIIWKAKTKISDQKVLIEKKNVDILNAQTELEHLNESLEVKVLERTAELTEANQSLIRKNREIEEALYKGQSIERKRVASELHDNLGGTLSAIKWRLEGMEDDSMTLSEKLIYDSILGMLKDAYADLRLISHNLLPEELEKNGLKNSIQKLVNEINLSKKLEVWLSFRVDENLMDNKLKLELYSICLELLNNTLKHADATEVAINFFMREGALFLQVLDDGKGMTPSKDGTGMGMKNINIRVESLNGKLKITPQEPKGTSVVVEVELVLLQNNNSE
jgi:signal transduction histidine kinase